MAFQRKLVHIISKVMCLVHSCLQEYDTSQFDALCLCLECGTAESVGPTTAYATLCDWLLDLSLDLIRPTLPTFPTSGVKTQLSTQDSEREIGGTQSGCKLRLEERFPYFTRRVCKARIWSDKEGALFSRLQDKAARYMEEISELCHTRCAPPTSEKP